MEKSKDSVLTQNSEAYHETLSSIHDQYGPTVKIDQVREWLQKNGFQEKPIEPKPRFVDLPKTKFVKQGHPLEYRVTETSDIPNGGPNFAVLTVYGERYTANMPLTPLPYKRSA